jgi:hypothetical protein
MRLGPLPVESPRPPLQPNARLATLAQLLRRPRRIVIGVGGVKLSAQGLELGAAGVGLVLKDFDQRALDHWGEPTLFIQFGQLMQALRG